MTAIEHTWHPQCHFCLTDRVEYLNGKFWCIESFLSYLVSLSRYAPALRQLRQVAFLVTFPSTIPSRLATRLLEVIWSVIRGNTLNIRYAVFLYLHGSPCLCSTKTFHQVSVTHRQGLVANLSIHVLNIKFWIEVISVVVVITCILIEVSMISPGYIILWWTLSGSSC